MGDFYLCYPAILTNTLVPQLGLSSILQNQLGVALDALTVGIPLSNSLAEVESSHCKTFTNMVVWPMGPRRHWGVLGSFIP